MRQGNFSVAIAQGIETSEGYVKLPHNTQYSLQLNNHDYQKRCAAEVKIDGKVVGLFRLQPGGVLILERPTHDTGKFTFYKDGTSEARSAGLHKVNYEDRGLVQVTFKPEKEALKHTHEVEDLIPTPRPPIRPYPYWNDGPIGSADVDRAVPTSTTRGISQKFSKYALNSPSKGIGGQNVSSGGTGLSGQSNQTFRTVGHLDYDENAFVTINLRLVASNDGPRELTSSPKSNPIPRPV